MSIKGEPRDTFGKKGSKADRNNGLIPCVMYGAGGEATHFTTTWSEVRHLIYTPEFKVAEIELGASRQRCLVKNVQFHPVTDAIIHIDFLKLVEGHPVRVEIPLRLAGTPAGVRAGGKLIQMVRKIKIKTVPEHLIDELALDVTDMDLGQTIRVRDIQAPANVMMLNSPSIPVANIEIPRALRSAAQADAKGK